MVVKGYERRHLHQDDRGYPRPRASPCGTSTANADPVQLARDGYRQTIGLAGAVEEVETVEDYKVSSVTPAIPLRVYRPQVEAAIRPYQHTFHGGGFISGGFDTTTVHFEHLLTLVIAIAAVEYRHSRVSVPAAPEDCCSG